MSSPRALDSNELATYSKIYSKFDHESRLLMCSETTKSHTTRESAANVLRDHEEPHNSGEKLFWGHHHFKQKGYIPNGSFGSSHFSVSLKDGHFAIAFFQRLPTKLMSPNSVSHQTNHTKNSTEVIKTSSHRNLSIEPITRINSIPTE